MTNRITEPENGAAVAVPEQSQSRSRLALLEKAQDDEAKLLSQYEDTVAKMKENALIRRGRIDELRRIVNAEIAAAKKE